jgi:hypothetical protein
VSVDSLAGWNSRYLAYCTATGENPLAPRTPMYGYILWITARWQDWRTEHDRWNTPAADADQEAFDLWLWTRVRAGQGIAS